MKKPKPEIEVLLEDLNCSDWKVRRNAAQALGTSRDERAVEPLIRVLAQDKSWTVRSRAAVALGRLKDERAIEPLILSMRASNWQLFRHAFNAIVKFGEAAVPALNRYSNDESLSSFVRNALVNAMGSIGAEGSLFALSQKLYDRDLMVRIQAIYALAQLKSDTVVDKLLQVLDKPEPLPDADYMDGSAPELKAMDDPKPHILKAVAESLAVLNDRRAVEPLVRLFADNEPYGRHTEVLMAATNALRQMGGVHTRDFAELEAMLTNDDEVTRCAAALSLSWLRDERAVDLLYGATRDPHPVVRRAATWALRALQEVVGYGIPMNPLVAAHILR